MCTKTVRASHARIATKFGRLAQPFATYSRQHLDCYGEYRLNAVIQYVVMQRIDNLAVCTVYQMTPGKGG